MTRLERTWTDVPPRGHRRTSQVGQSRTNSKRTRLTLLKSSPEISSSGCALSVSQIIAEHSRLRPLADAIVDGPLRVSYRRLHTATRNVAAALRGIEIGPGVPVGVVAAPVWETVIAIYAALDLGAIVIPIHPEIGRRELLYILQHSAIELLIGTSTDDGDCTPVPVPAGADLGSVRTPTLRRFVPLCGPRSITTMAVCHQPAQLSMQSGELRFYTSKYGSFLRGVVIDTAIALRNAQCFGERLKFSGDDRHLSLLPLSSATGLIHVLFGTHRFGGAVVLTGRFEPTNAVDVAVRERCTITGGAAVPVGRLLDTARNRFSASPGDFPIRRFWSVPYLDATHLGGLNLEQYTCYGLTEASNMVTASSEPIQMQEAHHGEPLPGVSVRIVDNNTGEVLEPGELGEFASVAGTSAPVITADRILFVTRGGRGWLLSYTRLWVRRRKRTTDLRGEQVALGSIRRRAGFGDRGGAHPRV